MGLIKRSKASSMAKTDLTNFKMYLNVGFRLDIPLGVIKKGVLGETMILGALAPINAIVGGGNNYKSTFMHELLLSAFNKIEYSYPGVTGITTYDTEVNYILDRLVNLANKYEIVGNWEISDGDDTKWSVYNIADLPGEIFLKLLLEAIEERMKDKTNFIELQGLLDFKNEVVKIMAPLGLEIDSLSEMDNSDSETIMKKIGDKGMDSQTVYLARGLFVSKFLSLLPRLSKRGGLYIMMSIHSGEKKDIGGNKYNQPTKQLQYMKAMDALKGATGKANFLISTAYFGNTAKKLNNPTTKLAQYPLYNADERDTDLNTVTFTVLRSKTGAGGTQNTIVTSQTDGFLEGLTNFFYLETHNKFGLGGNNVNQRLHLRPDVNIRRKDIRRLLDEDEKFARAVELTADLKQVMVEMPQFRHLFCTAEELYNDIKALGYDWDILLESRNWYTPKHYEVELSYLSILDLLRMRKGEYHPYWLKEDKVTKLDSKEIMKKYKKAIELKKQGK